MDATYFSFRRHVIKRLAFQLTLRKNLHHPFNVTSKMAGKKWLRGFLKRHSEMQFRKPQSITIARAQNFTRENVEKFFGILKLELQKIHFKGNRIFNVDETGITTVQHAPESVLTVKGKTTVH